MSAPFAVFAACQPGLEPLLAGELRALGIPGTERRGGVDFAGDVAAVQRAGLWLGTASHLLIRVATFRCRALGELQRKAAELPWRDWLRPRVALAVHATTRASRIWHTDAAAERVALAIGAALGTTPPAAADADEIVARVHVRVRDDEVAISLDATSSPLHRRGYRLDARKAPLREDLAHALLLASGWTPGLALLDPFCGSGTILIEAAGLARGLAPGRLRPPPLQQFALFDPDAWQRVRGERRDAVATAIVGGDRDAGAIAACRGNAERAGVLGYVVLHEGAFTTLGWLQGDAMPERGVLVTNPPFGHRIAKAGGLAPLYQTLGHRAAQLGAGWRVAILAHDPRLVRRTGLPLRAAWSSRHGGLPVAAMVGPCQREGGADAAPG